MDKKNTQSKQAAEFQSLLNKKKLTNAETATIMRVIVKRMIQVNENQVNLNAQNRELGSRIDRMEKLVLDQPKKGGGLRAGLPRSLQETQKTLGSVQQQLSALMLNQQVLQRLVPWMLREQRARPEPLTDEDVVKAAADIQEILKREGDEAVAAWEKVEEIGKATINCLFCNRWKEAPAVQLPGQKQASGCSLRFIQVSCPACQAIHGPPVNPGDVRGECSKCKTRLALETTGEDGTKTTKCGHYEPNMRKVRDLMKKSGVPDSVINAIANG